VISSYASALALPLSHVLTRLDGLYGNAAPLVDLLTAGGPGVIVRGKDYHLLNLPAVRARLQQPPDQQTRHPESGTSRALYDCLDIPLTPTGPRVRMLLAARIATASPPAIGTLHNGMVYEQFFTTVPPNAFTPADVLDLYLHRGSFETVLADEEQEQDPDRWVSHTPCGQEFWQILSQWVWNLRLEFGQQVSASPMRLTEFAYAQIDEPGQASEPVKASESGQASEPVKVNEPGQADASVSYGPAQWARRSFTKGFAGADFALQADGTLLCPADHPLYPQERRAEHDGSVRVHWPLSLLSSAWTVPGKHHHQQTAARERGVLATDFHHFTARSTAPQAASACSPGALGRLGALSAPTTLVLSAADTNRPAHFWSASARGQRGCSPTGCAYPCPTSPLATQLGATSRSQCSPSYRPIT